MKHELGEVWKDMFDPRVPWAVQFPKGIQHFSTKRQALLFGRYFKKEITFDEGMTISRYNQKYKGR